MRQGSRAFTYLVIALFFLFAVLAISTRSRGSESNGRSTLGVGDAAIRYPYQQLTPREQALYAALYDGISDFREEIKLPEKFTDQEYERVYLMLTMQEPQFFYLDEVYELSEQMDTARMCYAFTKEQAERMTGEMDAAANMILKSVSPAQTETQQFLMLHDGLASRCEYGTSPLPDSAYTALVMGISKCEGYAKAFLYLARKAGLEAMCVTGKSGRGIAHVWNMAKMSGSYYNIDVTWDDDESYHGQVAHTCFAMPDAQFGDHTADTAQFTPPKSAGITETFYHVKGFEVNEISMFSAKLSSWTGWLGTGILEFRCLDAATYQKAVNALRSDADVVGMLNREAGGWHVVLDEGRQVAVIIC